MLHVDCICWIGVDFACAGLEPNGVCALAPTRFTVETFSAGRSEIAVNIINPDGVEEEVKLFPKSVFKRLLFSCHSFQVSGIKELNKKDYNNLNEFRGLIECFGVTVTTLMGQWTSGF